MLGHRDIQATMRYLGLVGDEQAAPLDRASIREQDLSQKAAASAAKAT
jgi:hypothetical protein